MYITPKIFKSCKGPVSRRAVEAGPNFIPCSIPHFPNGGFFDGQSSPFLFECGLCYTTTGLQCRTADHSRLSMARISGKSRHASYIVPQANSKTKGQPKS